MSKKILIIGRGLSGSILSFALHQRGVTHDIIDQPGLSGSSRVAAGVVNPIVLKRLKVVQEASLFLAEATPFYTSLEQKLGQQFYRPVPIKHILQSAGEVNLWSEKTDSLEHRQFLGEIVPAHKEHLRTPFGYGLVKNTGWLHTEAFLQAHLDFHQNRASCSTGTIDHELLQKLAPQYDAVIVCTGHLMKDLFPSLAPFFSPTRGEVMEIESNELPEDAIYHGPVFILPLGNQKFKVGATYHWEQLKDIPTPAGLAQLKKGLEKIFTGNYKVVDHKAGVRPNTKDRKPLLGRINSNIYSFNGMGSRAVLMAPYLANIFLDFLLEGKELPSHYDLKRFFK